jgi:hypothetical protein
MKRLLTVLLVCVAGALHAQPKNVLFIGNSYTYTNDLPGVLQQLALSLGDSLNVSSSTPGGYTFQLHASYAPTLEAIRSADWDYVVLQEQSQRPAFPLAQVEIEVFPYAAQLVDSILANNACSQPVFYMTWGRQNGDADNCTSWPPVCTYGGMQGLLRERYLQMAADNAAFTSPVGAAWNVVRATHPFINLYNADQSHPSPEGTYLAACVFYSTLFRSTCAAAPYAFTLDPDTAAILRNIASSTVLDSMDTWNIGVNDPDASFAMTDLGSYEAQFTSQAEGQHAWSFGDGNNALGASPINTYATSGPWTVTHIVTDACGRSDTAQQIINLNFTGTIDIELTEPAYSVWYANGQLHVDGTTRGEQLTISDQLGRWLSTSTVQHGTVQANYASGLYAWHIRSSAGTSCSGKFVVP